LPSTLARDQETYQYDNLGEAITKTDRTQNTSLQLPQTHGYSYDILGRLTADAVTVLSDSVDNSILRLTTAYDTYGNPYLFTSYDAATGGNIKNQVQLTYNGLGQLTNDYQAHAGAVNAGTTPQVQYAYNLMVGGANNSRLLDLVYPNSRQIDFTYGTSGSVDSAISRLTVLTNHSLGIVLESYTDNSGNSAYLGLDTVVQRSHPESGINLTYIGGTSDANDNYGGLDRFGRVVNQLWVNPTTSTTTDSFAYGYDRNGNRLYQNNLMPGESALGELYHASGQFDTYDRNGNPTGAGYDVLNQLNWFSRGTLAGTGFSTVSNPTRTESWNLDPLGNWNGLTTNITSQNQTRTQNPQNEIKTFNGQPISWYDNNGNTTTDDTGKGFVYDAWNRLVAAGRTHQNLPLLLPCP
jgi:hypothetical protein